jgi:hypothetical protein
MGFQRRKQCYHRNKETKDDILFSKLNAAHFPWYSHFTWWRTVSKGYSGANVATGSVYLARQEEMHRNTMVLQAGWAGNLFA